MSVEDKDGHKVFEKVTSCSFSLKLGGFSDGQSRTEVMLC